MSPAGLRPDVPGKVHGIVSLDPPTIQCDGCGATYSHPRLAIASMCSGIVFNWRRKDLGRMCGPCWEAVE